MNLRTLAIAVPSLWVACAPAPLDVGEVTWSRDVQPLVEQRCGGCHTAGGIGPFALDTYAAAKPMAGAMAASTTAKRMPPWLASADCNTFRDDRSLTPTEIAILAAWAEQGAPEGEGGAAPSVRGPDQLAWVDSDLKPAAMYQPPPQVPDDFHCFVLDPALTASRQLMGFELTPGVRKMVHHVLMYAMPRATAQAKDAADTSSGYACSTGSGATDGLVVGGWVPGTGVMRYPAGTGVTIGANDALVLEIHYNLANGAEPDATGVRLQFAKSPVTVARIMPFVDKSFSVPPHATEYTPPAYPKTLSVPFSGKVWGVLPHMHKRGVKFRYEMETGGSNTCLLAIDKWDFNWQEMLMFAAPVSVPAGTKVRLSCAWSNELDVPLVWGEGTRDEMCVSYAYVTVD